MGNNPSKPAGGVASPPAAGAPSQGQNYSSPNHARREPRRRESIQGLPAGKTQPAHPSESITSATAQPTQSSSQKPQLHQHLHSPSPSSHQRIHREDKMGNEQSREKWREKDVDGARLEKTQSNPVRVPKGPDSRRQKGPDSQFEPSGPPRDLNYIPHSNLNFPPRLPLPIEEEIHTPGSPIITPADFSTALHVEDVDGVIPSRNSVLSGTTLDEDELGNDLQPYPADGSRRTVPTLVQWKQGGDKVYVTGTFASWSRKYRMYRE